jgi:hypothetical protein
MGTAMTFFIVLVNSIINYFVLGRFSLSEMVGTWIRNNLIAIPVAYVIVPVIAKITNNMFEQK